MQIAYTIAPGRGDTDLLLHGLAKDLMARGLRLCGTTQINSETKAAHPCDMDIQVLPDGPIMRISQSLGTGSKGCRLNPSVLEEAVGIVEADLRHGADLLIINKFGKHEAEGRGFRGVIAEAISKNIPVLVGTNSLNLDAFLEFAGSDVVQLQPLPSALESWVCSNLSMA